MTTTTQNTTRNNTSRGSMTLAIYTRHQELFYELLERLKALDERGDVGDLAGFLTDQLLAQVFGEEEYLYPRLRSGGTSTDTMSVDHEFIENYVRRIRQAAEALKRSAPDEQPAKREEVRRLGRQLEAILELHLAKEDHIYLPLLKQVVRERREGSQASTHGTFPAEEEHAQAGAIEVKDMIDVRGLWPTAAHARAFAAFGALRPGEAFILVSDRDPQPLRYELTWEYHGDLVWEPLERGPETWRVSIGKGV